MPISYVSLGLLQHNEDFPTPLEQANNMSWVRTCALLKNSINFLSTFFLVKEGPNN